MRYNNHDESLLIQNIGRLVTMVPKKGREGPLGVIKNAAVRIVNGVIVWVGLDGKEPKTTCTGYEESIDANGLAVMPGLVDAHTHLVHGGNRQHEFVERSHGRSYQEIAKRGGGILESVRATRASSFDDLYESAAARASDVRFHGVTTIEVKSGYGLNLESELRILHIISAMNENRELRLIPTFLGAHTVPDEYKKNRKAYIGLVINKMLPVVAKQKLAKFCDVYVENGAFTAEEAAQILTAAKKYKMRGKLHVDQFSYQDGGRLAASLKVASADHLDKISDEGILAMRRAGTSAVLLPGATFFVGEHEYAPARKLIDAGVNVAVATDYNPGTCPSLDLFLMATIAVTQMKMTAEEALAAITINAARALLLDDCGQIAEGKRGDLVILETEDEYLPLYRFASPKVRTLLVEGQVVRQSHAYNL